MQILSLSVFFHFYFNNFYQVGVLYSAPMNNTLNNQEHEALLCLTFSYALSTESNLVLMCLELSAFGRGYWAFIEGEGEITK